jgi:hypothetical protein
MTRNPGSEVTREDGKEAVGEGGHDRGVHGESTATVVRRSSSLPRRCLPSAGLPTSR